MNKILIYHYFFIIIVKGFNKSIKEMFFVTGDNWSCLLHSCKEIVSRAKALE